MSLLAAPNETSDHLIKCCFHARKAFGIDDVSLSDLLREDVQIHLEDGCLVKRVVNRPQGVGWVGIRGFR